MDTTRIIAVRHGETDWNASARIQGHQDIALNDKGRWQAEQAAQSLAADETVTAVYTSDLARAHATASAIAQAFALDTIIDTRLRERSFGRYEGQTFDEIERQCPAETARWRARDPSWAPPGGESLQTLGDRIRAVTDELAGRHTGEQIVLVAHGGVLDMLYRFATRQGMEPQRNWALGNASINRMLWTPDGMSIVGWSDTRHLDTRGWRDETIS
jgi:probable phosphoglycerate mutase